jgi:hypothetical protein
MHEHYWKEVELSNKVRMKVAFAKAKIEWISFFCGPELLHCGTNGGDMWTGQRDLEPSGSWG